MASIFDERDSLPKEIINIGHFLIVCNVRHKYLPQFWSHIQLSPFMSKRAERERELTSLSHCFQTTSRYHPYQDISESLFSYIKLYNTLLFNNFVWSFWSNAPIMKNLRKYHFPKDFPFNRTFKQRKNVFVEQIIW